MLTLAFAQIVWSIAFQWYDVHRRRQRHPRRLAGGLGGLEAGVLLLSDARAGARAACCCCGGSSSRRSATRCAPAATRRCAPRPSASTCAASSGWRSSSPARSPGWPARCTPSTRAASSPTCWRIPLSVDALVMVLLGGLQTLTGPSSAPPSIHGLQTEVDRASTDYWRLILGCVIIAPGGRLPAGASSARSRSRMRRARADTGGTVP